MHVPCIIYGSVTGDGIIIIIDILITDTRFYHIWRPGVARQLAVPRVRGPRGRCGGCDNGMRDNDHLTARSL
jgi:hypothetical protein